VILACLPERRLTRLFVGHQAEIRKAGFGRTREEFLAALKSIRRQGYSITRAEVDPGVVGVAVPVFGGERAVIGSLSVVFSVARFPESKANQVVAQLTQAAESIRADLTRYAETPARRSDSGRALKLP
jgi:DNA-binding IclR family transcriptional regulator